MHIAVALLAVLSALPLTPTQAAKVDKLEKELMSPCCYQQTIKDHMSDVAAEMREEVTAFVVQGRDEQEILNYYKAKYGDTILAEPDGLAGQILIGIPIAVFLLSTGLIALIVNKYLKTRTLAPAIPFLPDAEWQSIRGRIRSELGDQ